MTHELIFHVEPVAKGRPKFTKAGFAFTPKKTREAESTLKYLMKSKWKNEPLENPVRLELVFSITKPKSAKKRQYPSVKPDIDNLIKLVTDAGNEILWRDDNLIVEISARKEYGEPGIKLVVGEL